MGLSSISMKSQFGEDMRLIERSGSYCSHIPILWRLLVKSLLTDTGKIFLISTKLEMSTIAAIEEQLKALNVQKQKLEADLDQAKIEQLSSLAQRISCFVLYEVRLSTCYNGPTAYYIHKAAAEKHHYTIIYVPEAEIGNYLHEIDYSTGV